MILSKNKAEDDHAQQAMPDLNESTGIMLISKQINTCESLSDAEALRSMKNMMMMLLKKQTTVPLCLAAWTPPSPTAAQGLLSQVGRLSRNPVYHLLPISAWQNSAHDNAGSASSSQPS